MMMPEAAPSCARLREYTNESSPTGPTLGQQNYFMDVDAPNSPSFEFLAYPSGTMDVGIPLGTHWWAPLSWDIWTDLWLDNFTSGIWFWFNSVAFLDSSGRYYNNRMALPNVPLITSWPLHHVGYTSTTASAHRRSSAWCPISGATPGMR